MIFSKRSDLDDAANRLDEFFNTSRTLHATMREGAIFVVAIDSNTFDLLQFLINEGHLRTKVLHFTQVALACRALENIGPQAVKVILVDSELKDEKVNDKNFLEYLTSNYFNVPVFVDRCQKEEEKKVKKLSARIGILKKGMPKHAYVEALGLPRRCCSFVGMNGNW